MEFEANKLVADPTPEGLGEAKKDVLLGIARKLKIKVTTRMRNAQVQLLIAHHYIAEGKFEEEALELFVEGETLTEAEVRLQVDIMKYEHEFQIKQVEEKRQREEREKGRQFELERIRILQLGGPVFDIDDVYSLKELVVIDEFKKCVPDDEKHAATLRESVGLADKVVLNCKVEFTPDRSCPESNWEDQGNLDFEIGTGIESLEEADVPFACVQVFEVPVESQGTKPCVETQERSEVSDLVKKECSAFGSDGLGSVSKGLTLAPVESEDSQSLVLEGVLKVRDEMKAGDNSEEGAVSGFFKERIGEV
ncbi:uncharacterized protein LOC132378592 [Hypanus sabinus]|uniref:uncharacterized protein LOC132378592 n=1 Tax=Hypanus sabinus TaxID=79690 RepID=UPI0028C4B0B9|nr:uncharacterized protein LOC132378592 [Hypanus sabinus]